VCNGIGNNLNRKGGYIEPREKDECTISCILVHNLQICEHDSTEQWYLLITLLRLQTCVVV